MKKIILLLMTLLALPQLLFAQAADQVEMADKLRADGKIWVVVAVVAIVLAGIAINMFRVDSKVSRIEKELNIK